MGHICLWDIHIEFSQQGTTLSQVTDYQRQLNISKALATTSMSIRERDLNVKLYEFSDDLLVQCFTKEGLETLDLL